MPVQLCNINNTVQISRETMIDLDIFNVLQDFFPGRSSQDNNEIELFLQKYLTDDASEIQRRSEIISGFHDNPESGFLLNAIINEWERLSHSLSELNHSPRPLLFFTHMQYAMEAYISSIKHLEDLFAFTALPAAKEIADFVREQRCSSFYAEVLDCLQTVSKLIKPLDHVTLAVNVSESGEAAQIAITNPSSVNEKTIGMLRGEREDINSLCDLVPVATRGHLSQLEQYIITQVEKIWASPLSSAMRELKKINIGKLFDWQNWLAPIDLYRMGYLLLAKQKENGSFFCRPAPCGDRTEAKDMLYPHMVLSKRSPAPQAFDFTLGNTVMITGANNSGKTSVLKSFAQNCILAQLGFWVFANSFLFIPFKRWLTVFSAGEDSQLHASRYQQEAAKMRAAVENAKQDTCLLLNEPFTSTNPAEAASLLKDIVAELNSKNVTMILVTHIHDVYESLCGLNQANLRSYDTCSKINGNDIYFTFQLEERAPDMLSYARLLAYEYGFSVEKLLDNPIEKTAIKNIIQGGVSNT